MSDLRKAAEMALEALEGDYRHAVRDDAIDALRAALAQPEHETVMVNGLTEAETNASASVMGFTPPQRKPLTEEEIAALSEQHIFASRLTKFVRAIERAHGIGSEE